MALAGLWIVGGLSAVGAGGCASVGKAPDAAAQTVLDRRPPLVLEQIGPLGPGANKEISGIVRSRRDPRVFWTLNDSGDEPRVYPIRADGTLIPSVRSPETPGTLIGGAINGDWEDIALDASGRLIVADVGNNSNARRDLCLYILEEPEITEGRTAYLAKVFVRYPEQTTWPAPAGDFNYDCEGVFTVGDDIYLLTKHRADSWTRLYRVGARTHGVVNPLVYLERFDIAGQVTAADASDDGRMLVVLTYEDIWLFERSGTREPFFGGRVHRRAYALPGDGATPVRPSDSESICFEQAGPSPTSVLIADEARGVLYRARVEEIRR